MKVKIYALDCLACAALFAILFTALGVAGQGDYEDAVQASDHYNYMVCEGLWPDYEDRKPTCEDV